jgi:hypothetical protein
MECRDQSGEIVIIGEEISNGNPKHLAQLEQRAGIRRVLATFVLIDARRGHGWVHSGLHAKSALRKAGLQPSGTQARCDDSLLFTSACHPLIRPR